MLLAAALLLVAPPRLEAQDAGRLSADQTLLLILTPRGFTHKALTIEEGKTLLVVYNRTFFPGVTFSLSTSGGELIEQGRIAGRQRAWRWVVELNKGEYVVKVNENPDWIARITVSETAGDS